VVRNDQKRKELLEYAEMLAKDTQPTTTAKSQAEGKTVKNTTESEKETQPKKEAQSKKGKQQKHESQTQPKKEEIQSKKSKQN